MGGSVRRPRGAVNRRLLDRGPHRSRLEYPHNGPAASPCAVQATLRSAFGGLHVAAIAEGTPSRSGRGGGIMNTLDMSAPVTRGELREELALLDQKFDQKLEFWGGALLARITESEQRARAWITESEQRLLTELGRHTRAIQEAMATRRVVA
jgi:hypothetical protein